MSAARAFAEAVTKLSSTLGNVAQTLFQAHVATAQSDPSQIT